MVVALVVLLVGQAVALGLSVAPATGGRGTRVGLAALAAGVALWAVSLRVLSRGLSRGLGRRAATWAVLGGQLVLLGIAVAAPPAGSDDVYRYVWDGRVQAAGIDPYRYAPLDPALAGLRDPVLFPGGRACSTDHPAGAGYLEPDCTLINRPEVATIYPPVAEASFWLVSRFGGLSRSGGVSAIGGGRGGVLAFQIAGALAAAGVGLLVLRRAGPARAAVWCWCPPVLTGAVNDAHVDGLAVLLTVGGLLAAGSSRPFRAGGLVGAAVAVKITPAVVLPALVRSRWVRVGLAVVAVVALSYLPHVLALGPRVLGYLSGYLSEEGYDGGNRFLLLADVLGPQHARAAAVALLAVLAAAAAWRSDPRAPERSALLLAGGSLFVATPAYPWYGLLAIALGALAGRPRWVAVSLAPALAYSAVDLPGVTDAGLAGWAVAAAFVVVPGVVRVARSALRARASR